MTLGWLIELEKPEHEQDAAATDRLTGTLVQLNNGETWTVRVDVADVPAGVLGTVGDASRLK